MVSGVQQSPTQAPLMMLKRLRRGGIGHQTLHEWFVFSHSPVAIFSYFMLRKLKILSGEKILGHDVMLLNSLEVLPFYDVL